MYVDDKDVVVVTWDKELANRLWSQFSRVIRDIKLMAFVKSLLFKNTYIDKFYLIICDLA